MALRFSSETEQELLARAVDSLPRVTKFPVAFGGLTTDGLLPVTATAGTRTRSLAGLVVQPERGLGGRSLVEKRARLAIDYRTARGITHDYDRAVLGEGISTLFAVPVMVDGQARGVLYCGSWAESAVGEVVARAAFSVADSLATELRVRSEIDRRLSSFATPASTDIGSAAREELRESYAEIRSIAASISDESVKRRLQAIERRLAALSGDGSATTLDVRLSPREVDVLASVALGATNAEVAASLGLREGTVKSYLQSAMSKLDVSTRHAAVTKARRAGILP
ncbi:MAG: helix-turn-helix transcriptional regulator [Microbacterium sp. 67-17]|nr:LuxR C-terminal-related transcriptional regulator [Microbacterium sp. 67-17]OJV98956.1 MAG: helix-turn-helix transcriptional regulator [Microbacterium sp. 67-17]